MRVKCRFPDCGKVYKTATARLTTIDGRPFNLEWCTACGRIQNKK